MNEEKRNLIEILMEDFKQNEGKNAAISELLLLRTRLQNFSVEEFELLMPKEE